MRALDRDERRPRPPVGRARRGTRSPFRRRQARGAARRRPPCRAARGRSPEAGGSSVANEGEDTFSLRIEALRRHPSRPPGFGVPCSADAYCPLADSARPSRPSRPSRPRGSLGSTSDVVQERRPRSWQQGFCSPRAAGRRRRRRRRSRPLATVRNGGASATAARRRARRPRPRMTLRRRGRAPGVKAPELLDVLLDGRMPERAARARALTSVGARAFGQGHPGHRPGPPRRSARLLRSGPAGAPDPTMKGNLDVKWTIDPTGKVTESRSTTSRSDIHDPAIGKCVMRRHQGDPLRGQREGLRDARALPLQLQPAQRPTSTQSPH